MEGPPQAPEGGQEARREEVGRPRSRELRSRRAISAALAALDGLGEGRPLRLALAASLAEHPGIGPKERRHVAGATRAVARWLRVVDAALVRGGAPKAIPADRALLRYLAWRVAVEGDAPEAVAHDLRLPGPRRPRAISEKEVLRVARALPRPGPEGPLAFDSSGRPLVAPSDPVVALALRGSVPDDFARKLLRDLGAEEALLCLRALNRDARLTLRVNVSRATREEVRAALAAAGVAAEAGEGPWSLRVEDRASLFDSAPLRTGLAEVQDESSQRVVEVCRPGAGTRWLDLCAGSGGKALGLAALGAEVTAWDSSARRLGRAAAPRPPRRGQPPGVAEGARRRVRRCSRRRAVQRVGGALPGAGRPLAHRRRGGGPVPGDPGGAAPPRRRTGGSRRRAGLRHLLDLPGGRGGGRRPLPGRESGLPARGRGAALAPPEPGRRLLPGEARAAWLQGANALDGARGGALESALPSGACDSCPRGG